MGSCCTKSPAREAAAIINCWAGNWPTCVCCLSRPTAPGRDRAASGRWGAKHFHTPPPISSHPPHPTRSRQNTPSPPGACYAEEGNLFPPHLPFLHFLPRFSLADKQTSPAEQALGRPVPKFKSLFPQEDVRLYLAAVQTGRGSVVPALPAPAHCP